MMTTCPRATENAELCTRVIGEYLEMPGLSLTMAQACRLWDLDSPQCAALMDALLDAGFLRKSGDNYVRSHDGRAA